MLEVNSSPNQLTTCRQLVGFIAHPNPQIRQVAIENLVPYSTSQPSIFKTEDLLPVKHLKFLVRDDPVRTPRHLADEDPAKWLRRKSQSMPSQFWST